VEEVVYQFLLQTAGYPRASVISDATILFPDSDERPSFIIVDPVSALPLAVIHVVGAVDASGLYAASSAAETNAKNLKPAIVEGYVVRIDFKGKTDSEKVQFYRCKDKGDLYPMSASTFPDLDSLRVHSKLGAPHQGGVGVIGGHVTGIHSPNAANNGSTSASTQHLSDEELLGLEAAEGSTALKGEKRLRAGFWLGFLLVVLAIADSVAVKVTGEPLLQLTHVLLLVGAVLAFLLG